METISSLKRRYNELNEEWQEVQASIKHFPEVAKTWKEYESAVEAARESIKDKLTAIHNEQKEIDKKVAELVDKKIKVIPDEVNAFIRNFCAGTERGYCTVKWVSPSKKFVIVTEAGHMYWSGRGEQSYAKSTHFLFDITKVGNAAHGIDFENNCKVFSCEGRLTKDTIEKWKDYVLQEELQ